MIDDEHDLMHDGRDKELRIVYVRMEKLLKDTVGLRRHIYNL